MARPWALIHSERWTAEGRGEQKCCPLRNLSSTTSSSFSSSSCTPLCGAVLIDVEKRSSLSGCLFLFQVAQVNFFSPLFLVCHSSSLSLLLELSLLSSAFVSVCFLKLSLSLSQLNTTPFPTDCLCCSSRPLSPPCLVICISLLSPPLTASPLRCSDFKSFF